MEKYASRYDVRVRWDGEDKMYVAWAAEMPTVRVHGDTRAEALDRLDIALDLVIEDVLEDGDPVPEPLSTRSFSGKFSVRTSEDVHRKLATCAARQGVSLNALVNEVLARESERA